jgi:eukaryotic-like serine/threonine-protein kinase
VTGAPSRIGRYEIREELGRGTMGVVYEAEDPDLGRHVAVKTIQVPLAASKKEREEYEKRFLAEARIAARLSHSGIVVVHDVGRDAEQGILYIALEHLRGRTLAEVVAEGPLAWREALRIVGRLAEAVRYAHAQGVVHRDIKPANIMLVASGEPKIMDFGIAKLEAGQHTSPGQFLGTPLFMSPEQARGQPVDGRTDLFSLGSVAYLLLSGHPPFEADNVPGILARVAYQPPKPLRDLVAGLPPEAEYVVTRAMAKNPADRYPDGKTMAEDIEDILAGRPPRHRDRWKPPPVGAGTVPSAGAEVLPELSLEAPADPGKPAAPPRPRRRRTLGLMIVLGTVAAAYFELHPSDWRFWRRAVAEARRSRIGEEVRGWWGRVGLESPEMPAAPITRPPVTTAPMTSLPATLAAVTSPPVAPPPLASPPAAPPSTLAEIVSLPEDDPDPITSPPSAPASAPAKKGTRTAPIPPPKAHPAGQLVIEFEHHLKHGNLQVWVDDDRVVNDDFDGRVTHKILSFELRKGLVQQRLALSPGKHTVRVTVRWEDNTRTARIAGTFRAGGSRTLDVDVGRIGGKLGLAWK